MSEINILYTFDTRFWRLAAVSIHSVLKNRARGTECTIYCMVAPRTAGRHKIKKIVNAAGARLVWRVVRPHENPFRKNDFFRWSPVIFYRLFAHRIFPNVDRLLYLDSDTLVLGDLSGLYHTDISGYVLGAVPDMAPTKDENNKNGQYVKNFSEKYLGGGCYFNSGVLLINMRNMARCEHALQTVTVETTYPDQDIMNAALVGQILSLELKYNLAPGINIPATFPLRQINAAKKHPVVLHFYSGKPYNYEFMPRKIYSLFYKAATEIGLYPDDFIKQEIKHHRRRRPNAKTHIPFLHVKGNKLILFGIISLRV